MGGGIGHAMSAATKSGSESGASIAYAPTVVIRQQGDVVGLSECHEFAHRMTEI